MKPVELHGTVKFG